MQLYALCDQDTLDRTNTSIESFIDVALKHDATYLQYRNKNANVGLVKKNLLFIRERFPYTLIINDYIELVEFCDGLHLGQEDLLKFGETSYEAINSVKAIIGDKRLGISTHNKKEVLEANEFDLDNIGLGAYRATTTKDVDNILGNTLDDIASLSFHKVAAIGGVKLSDTFKHVTFKVVCSDLIRAIDAD